MPNETEQPRSVEVAYTPEFKRNIRQLAKKYRRIKSDVQPLLNQLGQGDTPGDQIPGVQYEVFKVRVRNSDSSKGKSGGYRVIYQRGQTGTIVLITIYSKTEQADIAAQSIRQIIFDYEAQSKIVASSNADEGIQANSDSDTSDSNEKDE